MKMRGNKFVALGMGLALAMVTLRATAEEISVAQVGVPAESVVAQFPAVEAFDYLIVRQDASALFEAIAGDFNLRLDITDNVHGTLSGRRLTGSQTEVLEVAAKDLGLDWFVFNNVLYVSDRSEAVTRIVRMGDLKPDEVMAALAESGLSTDQLDVEASAGGAALAFSGPPKLLAIAEAIIEGIPPAPVDRVADAVARIVTVRRGNEAEKVQLP
jgi:hypothetical protein